MNCALCTNEVPTGNQICTECMNAAIEDDPGEEFEHLAYLYDQARQHS